MNSPWQRKSSFLLSPSPLFQRYEWSILAGVVVEARNTFHCIALATGVKALPYDTLSPRGDLVHDSHAEVLARRGARIWLLARLMSEVRAHSDGAEIAGMSRLFVQVSDNRWRLIPEAKLHLYCSTFPCTSTLGRQKSAISIDGAHLTKSFPSHRWRCFFFFAHESNRAARKATIPLDFSTPQQRFHPSRSHLFFWTSSSSSYQTRQIAIFS